METNHKNSQMIQINKNFLDFQTPERGRKQVQVRKISDYPNVPTPYLLIAKHFSNPLLMGPPLCDELVALVQHMFTEEEAALVQHIATPIGKTAKTLAELEHRPMDEVRLIMDRLVNDKCLLISQGTGENTRYGIEFISPGAFELAMIQSSESNYTPWHTRFCELFAELYETGWWADYTKYPTGTVRYLPVDETIKIHQTAWPFERLEEIFDKYKSFSVGICQCRMLEKNVGRGCNKPVDNCIAFGALAEHYIQIGKSRRVNIKEVLEIKAEAAQAGLASYISETKIGSAPSGASCSCCGCCCVSLRTISQFNAPGMFGKPHFMPKIDRSRCTSCGRCARVCPVGALRVDSKAESQQHLAERCIGCGLCQVACDKKRVIQMEPIPENIRLRDGKLNFAPRQVVAHVRNAWSAWRKYKNC